METLTDHGLKYVLFAPEQLGIYAKPVTGGYAPLGPLAALRESGALAVLNGPMFGICDGQDDLPAGNAAYARSVCDLLEYRQKDGALDARGLHPDRGLTFSVKGGRATASTPGAFPASADGDVIVQTYPSLVIDGASVAAHSVNVDNVWRSALAIMSDGQMALVAGHMPMPAFAAALVAIGAEWAGYTDGGGSTALVVSDGPGGVIGSTEGRPVPSWLVVRKPRSWFGWIAAGVVGLVVWLNWRDKK